MVAIAGYVSRRILERDSHIRMKVKRAAVEATSQPVSQVGGVQNFT
jgi:hypothetical protein